MFLSPGSATGQDSFGLSLLDIGMRGALCELISFSDFIWGLIMCRFAFPWFQKSFWKKKKKKRKLLESSSVS